MNNNNRGNNRRRGRGNNNRQHGGGQQLNRIDSRARGNAPQMLEKYRKLAHDAHLNGDRVNEEYFLQFADHYFRVIADQRQRQDEQRQPRQDRWQESGDGDRYDSDTGGDFGSDSDYASAPAYGERRDRDDAPRFEQRDRDASPPASATAHADDDEQASPPAASPYEPTVNPFTRDNRSARGLKPRRERTEASVEPEAGEPVPQDSAQQDDTPVKPRRGRRAAADTAKAGGETQSSLDLAALPPAISARDGDVEAKPKRRTTRRTKPIEDDGESLQAVNN